MSFEHLNSRLSPSRSRLGLGAAGAMIAPVAVFLVVAGIGAATTHLGDRFETTASGIAIPHSDPNPGPDGAPMARLADYARTIGGEATTKAAAGPLLPDVNTMIERLAARLELAPEDINGWRLLGWSYFHTGRYERAAAAFARAVEIDPESAEIKSAYDEAKAKASTSVSSDNASSLQTGAIGKAGDGASSEKGEALQSMPRHERDAVIRAMVDGLATRLKSSPRDAEGWTRLMRSRVVLGEREAASAAFRKALEVFVDDQAASGSIMAAARELGLEAR